MDNMTVQQFVVVVLLCTIVSVASECTSTNKRSTTELNSTNEFQNLYSPGWRVAYLPSMDCKWLIDSGDPDTKLIIDVTYVNIENSANCLYDSLTIYDGPTTSDTRLQRMCDKWLTGKLFATTGQYALIQQRSDFSVQKVGFSLRYINIKPKATTACTSTESVSTSLATTGYINSLNFPALDDVAQTCTWLITASSVSNFIAIEIIFMDLNPRAATCGDEKLMIFDGVDNTATKLLEICEDRTVFPKANSASYTVVTTQGKAYIQLDTRKIEQSRAGFLLSYNETVSDATLAPVTTTTQPPITSQCGGSLLASSSLQFISSPGYPDTFYSNDINCNWIIRSAKGFQIAIDVVDSYIELSNGCQNDKVTIYDGSSSSYPTLARFCGENFQDVNSTGTSILVNFNSDSSTSARGFKLSYRTIEHDIPDCSPGGNVTNLNATRTVQFLESSNYPDVYGNNMEEKWLIYNPSGEGIIKIMVESSRIEASQSCVMDRVSVYKGPCTSYPLLGSFCGEETPTYYQDKGNYVLIVFTADERLAFKGFRISYSIVSSIPEDISIIIIIGIIVGCTLAGIILIIVLLIAIKLILKKRRKEANKMKSTGKAGEETESIIDDETGVQPGPSGKLEKLDVDYVMKKKLPILTFSFKPKLPKIERRAKNKNKK